VYSQGEKLGVRYKFVNGAGKSPGPLTWYAQNIRKVDLKKGIQTPMARGRSTENMSVMRWTRTSWSSIKNSLSGQRKWTETAQGFLACGVPIIFKAHILLYHSTPGLRVIKKKKKGCRPGPPWGGWRQGGRGGGYLKCSRDRYNLGFRFKNQ